MMELQISNARAVRPDSYINADGWRVESLTMSVCGHDVQVLRYDGNNRGVVVYVDGRPKQMPLERVGGYIDRMTGG